MITGREPDSPGVDPRDADEPDAAQPEDEAVEMIVDGTLDLHMFPAAEVKDLVRDYLEECLKRGILELRIVHGKGIGNLRRIVHGILEKHPAVVWYGHRPAAGSWGATVVKLEPPAGTRPEKPDESPED